MPESEYPTSMEHQKNSSSRRKHCEHDAIFKLDTDGIKTIWHFGIIDVPCIELYGIIGQMKEKDGESQ